MLEAPLVCGKCDKQMTPESLADQAFIGMITQADMSQAAWNAICRENGWPVVLNQGQMTQALNKGRKISPVLAERPSKPMCAYPGCGRWVSADQEHCAEHAASEILEPAMPF
jgi:hypothetical protein